MLVSPNGFGNSGLGSVREYSKITFQINDLRNPTDEGVLCRGTERGEPTPVFMPSSGGYHSVLMSFAIGAQHIGDCGVEIFDADRPGERTQIAFAAGPEGCAVPRNSGGHEVIPSINTDKEPEATSQCDGYITPGTEPINDMCTFQWTFQVQKMEEINCQKCVLRWFWRAQHNLPNEEFYDNCVDIDLHIDGRQVSRIGGNRAVIGSGGDDATLPSDSYNVTTAGDGPTDYRQPSGKVPGHSHRVYQLHTSRLAMNAGPVSDKGMSPVEAMVRAIKVLEGKKAAPAVDDQAHGPVAAAAAAPAVRRPILADGDPTDDAAALVPFAPIRGALRAAAARKAKAGNLFITLADAMRRQMATDAIRRNRAAAALKRAGAARKAAAVRGGDEAEHEAGHEEGHEVGATGEAKEAVVVAKANNFFGYLAAMMGSSANRMDGAVKKA
ncbi:hypothetical protein HDU96_000639 [Phlyctochytrium bullatum]|nr:hypothetical protein HDU96_000639 [Phlyctochytrium bullatum]